jgi:hypothetical protein
MDTQAMNVIQHLNQRPKRSPWQAIMRTIDGICIEGAISILHAFGYQGETLYHGPEQFTAEKFADEQIYPELQGRTAEETPVIWFWGGPPNKLHWYGGTLYTLLLDRILCEVNINGAKHVAEWIGIDEC